jgi:hypothetical protein
MVMVRSLPDIFAYGRNHCRSLLRGLYGQSDGTGKACGRPSQGGAQQKATASTRAETTMFCAGFSIRSARVPMCERMLSLGVGDQSNWRMDQCAIHMDGARTMLTGSVRPPAPFCRSST